MNHNQPKHNNRQNRGSFPVAVRTGSQVNYHVLKCRPVINQSSPQVHHDHLQVLLEIDSGTRYWMTVNIRSGQDQVYYTIDENYKHPVLDKIIAKGLPQGFTPLDRKPEDIALDYIREKLVDLAKMDKLTAAGDPVQEDISDMLTTQLVNVMRAPDARLYIFGSRFDDGAKYSSYDLAVGIHDVHMNQGSKSPHDKSNATYQDGALLAHFPSENRWSAVFLKFASQAEHTDNNGQPA